MTRLLFFLLAVIWALIICHGTWLVARNFLVVQRIRLWFVFRVDCSYCRQRVSGNPFAANVSHGACQPCKHTAMARILSEIAANQKPI